MHASNDLTLSEVDSIILLIISFCLSSLDMSYQLDSLQKLMLIVIQKSIFLLCLLRSPQEKLFANLYFRSISILQTGIVQLILVAPVLCQIAVYDGSPFEYLIKIKHVLSFFCHPAVQILEFQKCYFSLKLLHNKNFC